MSTVSAKLFTNGQSQAVRIPKALQFIGVKEVTIRKEGNAVIITPKKESWLSFAKLAQADDDFMAERPEFMAADRVNF